VTNCPSVSHPSAAFETLKATGIIHLNLLMLKTNFARDWVLAKSSGLPTNPPRTYTAEHRSNRRREIIGGQRLLEGLLTVFRFAAFSTLMIDPEARGTASSRLPILRFVFAVIPICFAAQERSTCEFLIVPKTGSSTPVTEGRHSCLHESVRKWLNNLSSNAQCGQEVCIRCPRAARAFPQFSTSLR